MQKLNQYLKDLIIYKNNVNKNYAEYQQITNNIINSINSLKNKFIFLNCDNTNDNKMIIEKENIDKNCVENKNNYSEIDNSNKMIIDDNSNKIIVDEDTKLQNKMATLKIINRIKKRKKSHKF